VTVDQRGPRRSLSVALTFDFDAMSLWIGSYKAESASTISRGEFGAFALPRILAMLKRQDVQATFFVPGHTALAYPSLIASIRDEGHEIGHHGFVHESPADFDEDGEREVFGRGLDALERVAGVRPRGYRAPGCVVTPHTIDILLENDIVYDSNFGASDFAPYYLRNGDAWSASDPYEWGGPVDVVEIPVSTVLNDFPYLSGVGSATTAPSVVREIWQGEFDYALSNHTAEVFNLCMHPQVIGRGSHLLMLERLIEYMKSGDGVVFEPLFEFVERWKAVNPFDEWRAGTGPAAEMRSDQR
jgi:peptidoglycan/xylan/chitin deacetylase (PgdA/CDA1 family)